MGRQRFSLFRTVLTVALLAGVALAGFHAGQWLPKLDLLERSGIRRTMSNDDVIRYLRDHYAIDADLEGGRFSEKNLDQMLQAMDPYSGYLSKDEFADFEKETSQRYVGIGVQIARLERGVVITRVFRGSPAEEAGLEPGDEIVAVGGKNTLDFGVNDVVKRISGPAGTRVRIDISRRSTNAVLTVFPARGQITFSNIETSEILEGGIGYVKITEFGQRTGEEFLLVLEELESQGMRGLVLDLRNNPGGLLQAAVAVAEPFFEKNEVIVKVKGFGIGDDEIYRSTTPVRAASYPIIVLMNRGSASASEIVAGALRASGRATIVGEQSYGKGTVQSIFALSNGEGLRMTTAHYFLPDDTPIEDGVGLEPDIPVGMSYQDAMRLRIQEFHGGYLEADEFEARFGFTPVQDSQLGKAIEIMKTRFEG